MLTINPYTVAPGHDLDLLVHKLVLHAKPNGHCPSYSTDDGAAETVRKALKKQFKTEIISGRTRLKGKTWFARYETNLSDGTEVLAETYPLAVCRLALLKVFKSADV